MRLSRAVLIVLVAACATSPLTEIPEREAATFRRCWQSVRIQYCQGIPDHQCIGDGEWAYRNTPPPRARWLAVQGCPQAVIADQPVSPPPTAPAQCAPPCRSAFVCVQGQCVSACNPPCPDGQTCTEGGTCAAPNTAAP